MSHKDQPPTWHRTAIVLTALFVLDLGYSGQGLFSIAVAAGGLIVLTVGALWSLTRGMRPLALSRGLRASAYLLLGVAAFAATRFHLATAEHHSADVIAACRAYQVRHGALPSTLQQLVPEFLPAVPRAKYTLAYGTFTYSASSEKEHTLMYVALPPFGRRFYHFEQGVWTQLD
jgi:hypothetical protein